MGWPSKEKQKEYSRAYYLRVKDTVEYKERTRIADKSRQGKKVLKDRADRRTPTGWARLTINAIRSRAKRNNIEFTIDRDDIKMPEICPVLGLKLEVSPNDDNKKSYMAAPNSPSVDRFDNTKGYIKGNVRVISNRANLLKRDAELWEMQQIVKYMAGEL